MKFTDKPVITSAMVGLFVLGMLYKNYLGQIKQWIHDKVAESSASSAPAQGTPGSNDNATPGAGGNPQLSPGVG